MFDIPIVITRSEAEASDTADFFEGKGFVTHCEPVFDIEVFTQKYSDLMMYDGLIATSQQSLKALPDHEHLYLKPLFTFGPKTAELAEEKGFINVIMKGKNAKEFSEILLADEEYRNMNLCYLRGEDISFDMVHFFKEHQCHLTEKIVYRAHPRRIINHDSFEKIYHAPSIILFFSKRSAEIFFSFFEDKMLHNHIYGCFSEAIADMLIEKSHTQRGFTFFATEPNLDSLFDNMKTFLYSHMG